ncbi:hypothetical protein [Actomonas aquatica]|uniref:Amidohydrolase-related domain-containing protein n=1 Tax=Actomonas aquatica TaxID=2866162 RepID=A0ABZ1CD39_9BACT|nr:hypothetical protein [Opitutus sp. WL0086]WRQ89594.1 hypothetical protein K1X11_009250 [Opitutus sp. WL0086]
MTFYDTNAWVGEWPFLNLPVRDPAALRRHWRKHGIGGGLVSSFAALWPTDPMPANRTLREAIGRARGMTPLPVLNLFGPGWEQDLAELLSWPELKAVRLAPGYGGWTLRSAAAREAAQQITAAGKRVVLTARLWDERHEHPALKVKPVKVADIVRWLAAVPDCTPLVHGLTRWEVEKLAEQTKGFLTDLSYAEWEDTLGVMKRAVGARRIVFGSLTPLHITTAQVQKVEASPQSARVREAVAAGNATTFLKL